MSLTNVQQIEFPDQDMTEIQFLTEKYNKYLSQTEANKNFLIELKKNPICGDNYIAYIGPMWAGKTDELVRKRRNFLQGKKPIFIFKPAFDTRSIGYIVAHVTKNGERVTEKNDSGGYNDSIKIPAITIPTNEPEKILLFIAGYIQEFGQRPVVMFDEYQFFSKKIVMVSNDCYYILGCNTYLFSIDLNFKRNPIGHISQAIASGAHLVRLYAVCDLCDRVDVGAFSIKKTKSRNLKEVGGKDKYGTRCKACMYKEKRIQPQSAIFF